jgi:hypothetical protein
LLFVYAYFCLFSLFCKVDATRQREVDRQAAREAAKERREADARRRAQDLFEEAAAEAKEEARAWQAEAAAVRSFKKNKNQKK